MASVVCHFTSLVYGVVAGKSWEDFEKRPWWGPGKRADLS